MSAELIGTIAAVATAIGMIFAGMHALLTRLERRIDARFDQVDARFEQVDARFAQVDARFDRMDARFDRMDARFDRMDTHVAQLETDLTDVKVSVARLEGPLPTLLRTRQV